MWKPILFGATTTALVVSAFYSLTLTRKVTRLESLRAQEVAFVREEIHRTITLKPEIGMTFWDVHTPKEEFTFVLGGVSDQGADEWGPFVGTGGVLRILGTVDTSKMDEIPKEIPRGRLSYDPIDFGDDQSVNARVLRRFMRQIIKQGGNWVQWGFGNAGDPVAIGYLQHPAGILVIVVSTKPAPTQHLVQCVHYASAMPARGGAIMNWNVWQARQAPHFFRPR